MYEAHSHSHPGFEFAKAPQQLADSLVLLDGQASLVSPLGSPCKSVAQEDFEDAEAGLNQDAVKHSQNPVKNQVFPLGFPLQGYVPLMLCHTFNKSKHNAAGFYYSQKVDGVRCLWTGKFFTLRSGQRVEPPEFFASQFPNSPLDGELVLNFAGFEDFERLSESQSLKAKSPSAVDKINQNERNYELLQKLLKVELFLQKEDQRL